MSDSKSPWRPHDSTQFATDVLLRGVFLPALAACPDLQRALDDALSAYPLQVPPNRGGTSTDSNGQTLCTERSLQRAKVHSVPICRPWLEFVARELMARFSPDRTPPGLNFSRLELLFGLNRLYPGKTWLSRLLGGLVDQGVLELRSRRYTLRPDAPELSLEQTRAGTLFRVLHLAGAAARQRIAGERAIFWVVREILAPDELDGLVDDLTQLFHRRLDAYRVPLDAIEPGQEHRYALVSLGGLGGELLRPLEWSEEYRPLFPLLCTTLGAACAVAIGSRDQAREVLQAEAAHHLHRLYMERKGRQESLEPFFAQRYRVLKGDTIWEWMKFRRLVDKDGKYQFHGGNAGDAQVAILLMLAGRAREKVEELSSDVIVKHLQRHHSHRIADPNVVNIALSELMRLRWIFARTGKQGEVLYSLDPQHTTVPFELMQQRREIYLEDIAPLPGNADGYLCGASGHHAFHDEGFIEVARFQELVRELREERDVLREARERKVRHISFEDHEPCGLRQYRFHLLGTISSIFPFKRTET